MFGKEVGNVLVKEDKEDKEMVKQVGRKVVMVIIMCPVRSVEKSRCSPMRMKQQSCLCVQMFYSICNIKEFNIHKVDKTQIDVTGTKVHY